MVEKACSVVCVFFFILYGLEFSFKLKVVRLMPDSEECVT